MTFTHLHNHTQYSVLDGHGRIAEYARVAAQQGQQALAITDHGTVAGALEFYTACKEQGVKPIIGCELYVDIIMREENIPYHLTVLASDLQGYRDLVRVNTRAHSNFYYRPRITLQDLFDEDMMRHWFVLTGCPSSPVNSLLKRGMQDEARVLVQSLSQHSKQAVVELMYHTTQDLEFRQMQSDLLHAAFQLSQAAGVPMVLTNDCHYVSQEDESVHQDFLKRTEGRIHGIEFDGEGFYLRSSEDMLKVAEYLGHPEAHANAAKIAEYCNLEIPELERPSWYVPSLHLDPEEEISRRCHADSLPTAYVERFVMEMGVIRTSPPIMNSYLVAADLVDWCRQQGIPATGRGSMAGSLVSYLLGITSEDPVKYKLNFKRAVNPARLTIPDFDIDVSSARRNEVLAYLASKYPHSAPIASYSERGVRGAARMVMRALNFTSEHTNAIAKQLPEQGATDADLGCMPEHARAVTKGYLGLFGNMTVHPAGILISGEDKPLDGLVPMAYVPSSKQTVTQFDMYSLKKIDMFKLDVLGLATLDALDLMQHLSGVQAPENDYEDVRVFAMLSKGLVCEIFQMDGYAARAAIRELGIHNFEDIVAINALVRPGASQFIPKYRTGDDTLIQMYPPLRNVLEVTRGLILYQEQVMEACEVLASFDDLEQDDIKEAIKYFRADVFTKIEPRFMQGCASNGHDGSVIWKAIKSFAGYAFNRCMSGQTIVYRDNGGGRSSARRDVTIRELYEHKNGLTDNIPLRKKYKQFRYPLLMAMSEDGRIRPAKVKDIYKTGRQRVYTLTTEHGDQIKATAHHRFKTPLGWSRLSELKIGGQIYRSDLKLDDYCPPNGRGKGHAAGKKYGRPNNGFLPGKDNPAFTNGAYSARKRAVEAVARDLCANCGTAAGRLERAHLDGDNNNNTSSNIAILCSSCHKRHGFSIGDRRVRYARGYATQKTKITGIRFSGWEDTYDIEMDKTHNFLANNLVVHNSHAVTYAATAYKMAWYKRYHPEAFYTAIYDKSGDPMRAILESLQLGVHWQLPDVNISDAETRFEQGKIILGLLTIKGVGPVAAQAILKARDAVTFINTPEHLGEHAGKKCNTRIRALLHEAGAFASTGRPGIAQRMTDLLGFNPHIVNEDIAAAVTVYTQDTLGGFIADYREHTVKETSKMAGKKMGFVNLINASGEYEVTMFPETWKRFKKAMQGRPSMAPVILRGKDDQRGFVAEGGEFINGADVP